MMRNSRWLIGGCLVVSGVLIGLTMSRTDAAATPAQVNSFLTYEGFRNVRTHGNDSTWGQGLTHRHVNGELRFLSMAHPTTLYEFRIADRAFGETVTEITGSWDLAATKSLNSFNGLWFEQAKNRLWITSAEDYTATSHAAKVTTLTLGNNGAVTNVKTIYLEVPAKRVYGGCNAVPAALVERLGGPYVCGWGGYTSLIMHGGGASLGPAMFAIPDPDTVAAGATAKVKTILDTGFAEENRGVRKTIPVNYFDGGDTRQNPPSRPSGPPANSAKWLSPNSDGLGWMTWGDSYYNTGVWLGDTYAAVASLCKGSCWYQSSTLAFDGRQFELHTWNGASLGRDRLARPTTLTELELPRGNTDLWYGNVTAGNVTGATYDAIGKRLYLIGFPLGSDVYTGRLYSFIVDEDSPSLIDPPPPDNSDGRRDRPRTGPSIGTAKPR